MEKTTDYEYASLAIQQDARNPFEKINVGVVLTKNYMFTVPLESKAGFGLASASNSYDVFQGKSIEEGVTALAQSSETADHFEGEMRSLLAENPKWIYEIADLKHVKFVSLFGKQAVQLARKTKMERVNINFKHKAEGKALRAFHQKNK